MRLLPKYSLIFLLIGASALSGVARAFTGPGTQPAGSGGGLFYVDANRNIGFGLTDATPAGTFDDNSTGFGYVFTVASTTNPGLSIRNLSASGKTYVWSSRNSGNLSLYREAFGDLIGFPGKVVMDITPIGNVGISVFNPTQRLEVGGNVSSTAFYGSAVNLTSIDPQDFIANSAFATGNYAINGALVVGATSTTVVSGTSLNVVGTTTLATSGGRVGIGTTAPNALLQVGTTYNSLGGITPFAILGANSDSIQSMHLENSSAGTSAEMRFLTKANDGSYLAFTQPGTGNTGALFGVTKSTASFIFNAGVSRALVLGTNLNNNLIFGTNNLERMRILGANGYVGIGTTTPATALHVYGTSTVSGGDLDISTTGFGLVFPDGTKQTTAAAGGNLWSASSTHIYNSNSGNVGIGTSVPPKKLTVKLSDTAGTDEFLVQDSAGVSQFSVDSNGNVLFAAYPAVINFNNAQTNNFNAIVISDPGPGEGLSWSGTAAGWNMDISPLDRVTNGDGNLNLYGTANNVAVWRPLLFVTTSSTYTTATQSATGLNFTTTGGSGNITFNPGGKVGIGTTTPAYPLEIEPSGGISADMSAGRIQNVGSPVNPTDAATRSYVDSSVTGGSGSTVGYWTASSTDIYNSNAGSVGIGKTTPRGKLDVYLNASSSFYTVDNGDGVVIANPSNTIGLSTSVNGNYNSSSGQMWYKQTGGSSGSHNFGANGVSALYISGTGNVGVGTTTPAEKLEVVGKLKIGNNTVSGENVTFDGSTTAGMRVTNSSGYISITPLNASWAHIYTDRANFIFDKPVWSIAGKFSAYSTANLELQTAGTTRMSILAANGNVGIGTTTPAYRLEVEPVSSISADMSTGRIQNVGSPVNPTDAATRSYVDSAVTTGITGSQNYIPKFATANTLGNSRLYDSGTNLGLGTSTPSSFFHIYNDFTGQLGLRIENPHTLSDGGVQIALSRGANYRPAQLRFQTINTDEWYVGELYNAGQANTNLNFSPGPNAASSTVVFTSAGSVGIGTITPANKLEVAGTLGNWGVDSQGAIMTFTRPSANYIRASDASGSLYFQTGGANNRLQMFSDGSMAFNTNQLYLVSSGNIGIGTTTPAYRLEVEPVSSISADMSAGRIQNVGSPVNPTDAATRSYVDSSVTGGSGSTVGYWTASSTDIYNSNANNVGIGAASTPNYKLKVFGTFAADSGLIYTDNAGTLTGTAFYDRNNAAYFVDPSAATSMKTAGSVMIGGSGAPGTTLDVAGDVNLNNQALTAAGTLNRGYYVYKSGTTAYGLKLQYTGSEYGTMMFGPNQASRFLSFGKAGALLEDDDMVEYMRIDLDNGNVGIGTNNPGTNKLYVNGATYINGNLALGANNISMTGNIGNVTKLTVVAIDPLYEIDGAKYATYAASVAGGVKEEYVGKGMLKDGEYSIDFRRVEKGSDLWVWFNAVDFSADNIEVLATAYRTPTPIAYEVKGDTIVFRSSYDGALSFSYRLIGKRHDWKNWPTYAKDQNETPSFPLLKSKSFSEPEGK